MKNQLAGRGRGTRKNKEKGHNLFGNGRNNPVLVGHVMVGPLRLPSSGIDILPRLVGILEDKGITLFPPKTKVLVVGRQVKNIFPKMDPKGSGALVLDFDRQIDIGDAVFFLNCGSLRIEL